MKLAAVRVRGEQGISVTTRDALDALRLRAKHICVVYQETPLVRGALRKCKDFITYGPITDETAKLLAEKRGAKDAEGKLKPFFRLHPPRGGFERKGIKVSFAAGGALGERPSMDALIRKML